MATSDRVRRDDIDGVPVFWTPASRCTGALHFRVGVSDETAATRGITHLLEHIALHGVGQRAFPVNGAVDHIRTVFVAQGTGDEVSGFLREVCVSLSALPLDRLAVERRILQTEGAARPASLFEAHLALRHGARGFGLVALDEYGLHTLDGPALANWSATRFTRSNAALSFAGPPPDGLRIALPEGPYHPTVPRVDVRSPRGRCWIPIEQIRGIGFGSIVDRTAAGVAGQRILTRRLEQRLRHELGFSYEVSLGYVPLDGSEAQSSIFASCLPDRAVRVRNELLEAVDSFGDKGPTGEELAQDVEAFARSVDDEDSVHAELDSAIHETLLRRPVTSYRQCLEELRAVRPEEVRDAFASASRYATLVDGLDAVPDRGGWSVCTVPTTSAVAGRMMDAAARRFWHERKEHLIVGDEGVSWTDYINGTTLTVRYANCVALVQHGPLLTLLAEDGTRILVHRDYWRGGEEATREILRAVPGSLIVRVDAPDG